MVLTEVATFSEIILKQIGSIGLWLQALGVVVVISIALQIIAFFFNKKRMKEIYLIKQDMKRIESKIDKILSKKR